jgi:hypothetical protein
MKLGVRWSGYEEGFWVWIFFEMADLRIFLRKNDDEIMVHGFLGWFMVFQAVLK